MRRDDVPSSSNPSYLPARTGRQGGSGALARPLGGGGTFDESPFQMMRRMQEDMDRVLGSFFTDPFALMAAPSAMHGMGGGMSSGMGGGQMQRIWQPSVDISEDNGEYRIEADLPGVRPEDIDVRVQQGYLILRSSMNQESDMPSSPQGQMSQTGQQGQQQGQQQSQQPGQAQGDQMERQYHRRERRYGYFQRVFALPDDVDENAIRCDFDHGVLVCHVPKKAQAPQEQDISRRIPINAAGQQSAQPAQMTGGGAQQPSQMPGGQSQNTMADRALREEESHEHDVASSAPQTQGGAPSSSSTSGKGSK